MKPRFPFRLGTTSYVIPADILPNVRFLAEQVDDVEILLFESVGPFSVPSTETVSELVKLAADHGLTYTVHLPTDIHTGHAEESERRRAVESCRRIIERLEPVAPFAYIMHLAGGPGGPLPATDLSRWQALHRESLRSLLEMASPERICIENLDYPFAHAAGIVCDLGLSICCDIGHLLRYGGDVDAHLDRHWRRTRVIHLHGLADGRDHRSVSCLESSLLRKLMRRFRPAGEPERLVTIEVFAESDFRDSLQCLGQAADALQACGGGSCRRLS